MELKSFLAQMSKPEREAFAKRCGTSLGHLQNVSYGKTCAPALATAIEQQSSGVVKRADLRPKDWRAIWPELVRNIPRVQRTAKAA